MRRRSPVYSPPRRGYGGRDRSPPPRGRHGGYRDGACGLLVRNIPKSSRAEDLRAPFEQFGRVRDVYLPKDYYTGEPRGFGFVQYLNPIDAAEAKRYMDRRMFNGREITVVFAEENRKKPDEMRMKERQRGRMGYGGRRSPYRGYTSSRASPPDRSPSPRKGHYSRRERYVSVSPARGNRLSSSPDAAYRRGRERSVDEAADVSPTRSSRHGKYPEDGRSYASRSKEIPTKSPTKQMDLLSHSRSPAIDSRSRSRSRSNPERESRSPSSRSHSPPPRRQKHASISRSPHRSPSPKQQQRYSDFRDIPDPRKKSYSSLTPEERSPEEDINYHH